MKENEWSSLNEMIRICRKCVISGERKNVVLYRGSLQAFVMFIGEAPGKDEDETGVPFVGRAGKILDKAIADTGLTEKDFIIVNVLKCRPAGNKYMKIYEKNCISYLNTQIEIISPKLIVTLGMHALAIFSKEKLIKNIGIPIRHQEYTVIPMLHPASVLHDPRKWNLWNDSWNALKTYIEHKKIINEK